MGTHGVLAEERLRDQPFEVDLDLHLDLAAAGRSDDVADTVDYGRAAAVAAAVVVGPSVNLLERLAARIAEELLAGFGAVEAVTVTVRKLRPPVALHLDHAAARVHRRRGAAGGSGAGAPG